LVSTVWMENLDQPESLDLLEDLDHADQKVSMDLRVITAWMECLVLMVSQVEMDLVETSAQEDSRVNVVRRVNQLMLPTH